MRSYLLRLALVLAVLMPFLLLSASSPIAVGMLTASAQIVPPDCEVLDEQSGSDQIPGIGGGSCDWGYVLYACGCVDLGTHNECQAICTSTIIICTRGDSYTFFQNVNCG
jgi:hypothetical protein